MALHEKLVTFLRKRGLEDVIEKFEKEKVDTEVLKLMSPDDLKEYMPRHGDRIATVDFIKSLGREKSTSAKDKLLNRLRKKMQSHKDKESSSETESGSDRPSVSKKRQRKEKLKGNENAKKPKRRLDLGWIVNYNNDESSVCQVKQNKGGGTRKLTVDKDIKRENIIEEGKRIFFPKGKSKIGKIDDFEFDVWDFMQEPMENEVTVEEMYQKTKVKILRLYVVTTKKKQGSTSNEADSTDSDLYDPKIGDADKSLNNSTEKFEHERPLKDVKELNNNQQQRDLLSQAIWISGIDDAPSNDEEHEKDVKDTSRDQEVFFATDLPDLWMTDFGSQDVTLPLPSTSSQNNLFIGDQFGGGEAMEPTEDKTTRILKLHEKNILSEMISYFKDQTIINDKITIKRFTGGKVERGEGEGLLRDVYTEFWADFYLQCTIGCTYKVPELRHEFQEEEWEAIGRIILKGYLDVGYFPISISPTIFEECLFFKFESNILECFFLYIPLSEVNCIKQAIENFDSVDKDELIEILDSHQSHVMPTKDNLKSLIIEIANKQMVQDPHFVVDVWKRVLQPLTKKINIDKLKSLYDSAVPNTKRVLDLLKFSEPQTPGQAKTISLAKTFIRELDNEMIKVFLRYCTGSDLITEQIKETKITVDFVHMKETIRRPIARTCGCILELSDNFKSVSEFRAEFSNILKSGIFIMDIV